jgi:hypothetical protein
VVALVIVIVEVLARQLNAARLWVSTVPDVPLQEVILELWKPALVQAVWAAAFVSPISLGASLFVPLHDATVIVAVALLLTVVVSSGLAALVVLVVVEFDVNAELM